MGDTAMGTPDNNPGMIAAAQASQMSTMYRSNAMVATAGLQAATQMYQANLMYLMSTEALDVKREVGLAEIDYKMDRAGMKHEEAMGRIANDEMEIMLESQEEKFSHFDGSPND
jgi:hypothetical protein